MTERVYNFGAGPAVLPEPVLERARDELLALPGVGMSVLEISHRSAAFTDIIDRARANVRTLAGLSDDYHVLFLQGGASQQFAMVPLNLMAADDTADYTLTGTWARKAAQEAGRFGGVHVAATTEADDYTRTPEPDALDRSAGAAYLHLTSNNTIVGTRWPQWPAAGDAPLVVDASSDVFSRPVDLAAHGVGLLYAGAQKNLGPAGVTLVIVRDDLVRREPRRDDVPTTLRYATAADSGSLYNTPPVFAIYLVGLVTDWLIAQGGLSEAARRNAAKADMIYAEIDRTEFYRGTAQAGSRSQMNVTVRLPSEALEQQFVKEAGAAGLSGLKGHRSVGGIRASIYNAFPAEGVEALTAFMREFERTHG